MKYYRGKENIFLMTLTLIGAIVWIIIGRPQSINDIYMGIGINARPIYYMQFLGEYIVYAWACMGFMQTYLKRGGIYKVIREKSKKKYICQMEFRLALYLIYLIVIRFIIYSTCFVIANKKWEISGSKLLIGTIIYFITYYVLCFIQVILEIWVGQKTAFLSICIFNLCSLGIGDCIAKKWITIFPINSAMELRRKVLIIGNISILEQMIILICILIGICYLTIKERDFLKV